MTDQRPLLPFHILIRSRISSGTYPVSAAGGPVAVSTELQLPDHLLRAAAKLIHPEITLPLNDPEMFGRLLASALFVPLLRDTLLRCARTARLRGARLQIQLEIEPLELAALPWEWLLLGGRHIWAPALREDYVLVRVHRYARLFSPLVLDGPLCILAIATSAETAQLEELERALQPDIHAGRIRLRLLPHAAPALLGAALARAPAHILHCAAPAISGPHGAPRLALGRELDSSDFAAILRNAPELRLVTLNGAKGNSTSVNAALPLLASRLADEELPPAITVSGTLPALLTAHFAAACYHALAIGQPLDMAVVAGRRAIIEPGGVPHWGTFQVHLARDGAHLFTVARKTRELIPMRVLLPALGTTAFIAGVLLLGTFVNQSTTVPRGTSSQAETKSQGTQRERQPLMATPLPSPIPTVTPRPSTLTPTPLPTPTITPLPPPIGYATFVAGEGDTLERIAERMGSESGAIATLNHLDPMIPLRPGHALVIPIFRAGEGGAGGLIIHRGNPNAPRVALTFDIEIDDTTLYGILDILRSRGLRGTFFVTGMWVKAYPNAARALVQEGHEIANHSMTHPSFARIGVDGMIAELQQTEQIVLHTTGTTTRPYFRFPYGASTAIASGVVANQGFIAYHWIIDDGGIPLWLQQIAANPSSANGAILLMHGRHTTVASLAGWIDQLIELGLQPTSLGKTLE